MGAGRRSRRGIPLTLASRRRCVFSVAGEDYAIPLTHVAEAVELGPGVVGRAKGGSVRLRGEVMPLVRLRGMLQTGAEGGE